MWQRHAPTALTNFNSLSRRVLGARWQVVSCPGHLAYFTTRSLERMLTDVGLHRENMRTTGLSGEIEGKITSQVAEITRNQRVRVSVHTGRVRAGRVGERLAGLADEVNADLVVVGCRGHSPLGGLMIGSVTQRLLHHTARPVLVVPRGVATPAPARTRDLEHAASPAPIPNLVQVRATRSPRVSVPGSVPDAFARLAAGATLSIATAAASAPPIPTR